MKGIKLLLCGLESTGKTTLTSSIDKSMVISVDAKKYPYPVPHYEVREYNGIVDFRNTLVEKIKSYKVKYGELPKTIILDTVTKLYELIYLWAEDNYKGFDVHNAISKDTLRLNSILESTLIDKGINVVIVAHTQYDQNTNRFIIPATGKFKDSGSWLSVVDEASYIYILGNDRYIAHKELKYPCRSTLDLPASELLQKYDINKHIFNLEDTANKQEQMVL